MMLSSHVSRFRCELPDDVGNAKTRWSVREGLNFVVEETLHRRHPAGTSDSRRGLGEASPLPNYSPDNIDDCERCLRDIQLFDASKLSIASIAALVSEMPALPAARFAVETALLDLFAQRKNASVSALFGQYASSATRCSLLDIEAPIESARSTLDRGIRCAKLKIGGEWAEEYDTIRKIRIDFPSLALRLDVNAAWTLPEAKIRLALLQGLGIDFVEQPVAPGVMYRLGSSPVPLAADESIHSTAAREALVPLMKTSALRCIVLKPTVLGGIMECLRLQHWARGYKVKAIASHCFEGPVGTAAVAELALALDSSMPAGIDTHSALAPLSTTPIPQFRNRFIRPNLCGLGVEIDV